MSSVTQSIKRQRFENRKREMLSSGAWAYYPGSDLFVELVSTRLARWTPPGESRFLPRSREVYGREVFEVPDPIWRGFLEGEPRCMIVVDAWRGHPQLQKAPSDSCLYDPAGFAVSAEGTIGR